MLRAVTPGGRAGPLPLRPAIAALGALAGLALATGCIRAAGSVAEPTAIERQLLGAYQKLDRELVWVSSVRGPGGDLEPLGDLESQALRMRLLQRFNEDDLAQLRDWGCVAEGQDARVIIRACDRLDGDAQWRRIRDRVVGEENEARDVIITWAATQLARRRGRGQVEPRWIERVRAAYADLMREAAEPEHLIEIPTGELVPAAQWSP